jgi:hypothetical protein
MVFPKMYAGMQQEERTLLEVLRRGPASPVQLPPDMRGPFTPWTAAANAASAASRLVGDGLGLVSGLGLMPLHAGSDLGNFGRMAQRAARAVDPYRPDLYLSTLNLKQFRDGMNPDNFCYQALTNAKMKVLSVNQGGLLGDLSVLAGDTTGGLTIRISRWPALPIIDLMGLQVASEWSTGDVRVAELEPVSPFWYDVNMSYERGENLAWRSLDNVWRDPQQRRLPEPIGAPPAAAFNTTLGAAGATVGGTLEFQDSSTRVLPLLADRSKLVALIDRCFNDSLGDAITEGVPAPARIELWAAAGEDAYVYLLATTYGGLSAQSNNVGDWATQDLTFFIPVKVFEGDRLRTVAVVPVYTFASSNRRRSPPPR